MPFRGSGRRMYAGQIVLLVTGAAFDRIQALAVGSAADLHCMLMTVVSLTGKVSGGVTIHAARMAEYGNDVLESGRRGSGIECQ
jgi:hypothetical protein